MRASRCSSSSSPIRYERPPPITSTTSPGPDLAGEPGRGRLDAPGRLDGDRGRSAAATAAARPAAELIDRVGVAARPDVGDRHGVGRRERLGEGVEQRRGPVVRQRLVDGPDAAAGLALADGGQRLADRRRVVAVVVVDHDAPRPRPCARAAAPRPPNPARPAGDGVRRRRPAPPRRRRRPARWPRCGAPPSAAARGPGRRAGRGPRSRGWSSRGRSRDPAEERLGGPARAAEAVHDPAGVAADPLRRRVDQRRRDDPPGPVAEPRDELGDPRRRRRWRRAPAGRRGRAAAPARRIHASKASSTAARSANTSGWSHSAEVSTMTSGR